MSANKPHFPVYLINELAQECDQKVIWCPIPLPFQTSWNDMAQIKDPGQSKIKSSVSEAKPRLQKSHSQHNHHWENVTYTERVIEEEWQNKRLLEVAVKELIIHHSSSSRSSDSDSDKKWCGTLSQKLQSESNVFQEAQ